MQKNEPELLVPSWVRYEIAPFLHGKGLCFGTMATPITNPASKTKDFFTIYGDRERVWAGHAITDQEQFFRLFAKNSMDHVVLGPKADKSPSSIKLAKDRLRPNGVLVMYGKQSAGPGNVGIVRDGWWLSCNHPEFDRQLPPNSTAIIRYGAYGDLLMLTPLLRQLRLQGHHITVYTQPRAMSVLENNPNVHRLLVQEPDCIAIQELSQYFEYIKQKYKNFIDLCESVEGSMLKLESRKDFYMPKEWRDKTCQENYYRRTLRLGGVESDESEIIRGEVYLTLAEDRWAQQEYKKLSQDGRYWLWGWTLHGTSPHKCYPLTQPMLLEYLAKRPNERVVLLGEAGQAHLEFDHPQVIRKAGCYTPRQLMAIVKYLQGIVSPESFIANLGAAWDKPVITLLSHSSRENLCSTWLHDYSLEPSQEVAPCFPCHQLHYTPNSCPQREIIDLETNQVVVAGPACVIGAIPMDVLASRMIEVYDAFNPANPSSPANPRAQRIT